MVVTPEEKASAGRVLIVPKGEWNANITYEMLDMVNHNGYAWLAKRTSVGIEPSDDHLTYWHNMLDIKKIIENAIANTVADEVGDILESRFRDMLSEARPVTDLIADYTEATFVQWNADTENTPYKAGITECSEGFALVYGTSASNHTIVAWTMGAEKADCFTCSSTNGVVNDWESYLDKWEKCLPKSGGTMTGPLGLGDGKGTVSADSNEAFLEATEDSKNYRRIKVANPSSPIPLGESAKLNTMEDGVEKNFTLFGTHNLPNAAQIKYGTYDGDGTYGISNPTIFTADFDIKAVFVYQENLGHMFGDVNSSSFASNIAQNFRLLLKGATSMSGVGFSNFDSSLGMSWNGKSVSLYDNSSAPSSYYSGGYAAQAQMNAKNTTYHYILIG